MKEITKVIRPRLCPKCQKTFYCTGNCPTENRTQTASKTKYNCYCKECYLEAFGKDRAWTEGRKFCYVTQFNPSRRDSEEAKKRKKG